MFLILFFAKILQVETEHFITQYKYKLIEIEKQNVADIFKFIGILKIKLNLVIIIVI